jgi:hypothetical protein
MSVGFSFREGGEPHPSTATTFFFGGFLATILIVAIALIGSGFVFRKQALGQAFNGLTARTFGNLLCLTGLCMVVPGFPLTLLSAWALLNNGPDRQYQGMTIFGSILVGGAALLGGGVVLRKHGASPAKLHAGFSRDSLIGLIFALLAGVCALTFAFASCVGGP